MIQIDFKGDLESVTPEQLNFIKDVLEKRGYKTPEVLIKEMGEAGDNYMSNVMRIHVTENGETLKMIAKLALDNKIMREMGNVEKSFINEHVIYTEVLPKFSELQRSAGVPEEDMFRFAECYGTNLVAPFEVILLEDLSEDKYVMLDRFKPLSNESVKTVLKDFAIFHSLSFVLKHQESETFSAVASKLTDVFDVPLEDMESSEVFFRQLENNSIAILTDEKYKKVLRGTGSSMMKLNLKIKSELNTKYSIIQQGDGWINNILFKLQDEKPQKCVLIDYQLARENNPCFDIMYMLFSSTSYEQRKEHYYEFIDYYHAELDKSLNRYGLEASSVYPRDQLDVDLKRHGQLMLATNMFLLTFMLRKSEQAAEFKEAFNNSTLDDFEGLNEASVIQDPETVALFRERLEGLVDSFLEFGLIELED